MLTSRISVNWQNRENIAPTKLNYFTVYVTQRCVGTGKCVAHGMQLVVIRSMFT
jgi:hypothetical protein